MIMRYTRAQIVDGTGFEAGALFEQVEDHNGWTNRETWAVALHINNDQGWQESVHEALQAMLSLADCGACGVEDCRDCYPLMDKDDNALDAARAGEVVRENVEDLFSFDTWSEGGDYATVRREIWLARDDIGSLYRVNWTEIGQAFLADVAPEVES